MATTRKTTSSTPGKKASAPRKRASPKPRQDEDRNDETREDRAQRDRAQQDRAQRDRARQDRARQDGAVPLRQVVLRAAGELRDLVGRNPEGVVGVERLDDGGWKVQIEVVESHRIPDTTDILAVYELVADSNGAMLSYRRLNRYVRGRFEE